MRKKDAPLHPLRQARLSLPRPLTQVQLAELVGIGISTVERAESGKPIRVDNIQLLCAFFDKDAQELGLLPRYGEGTPSQEATGALSAQPSTGSPPQANSGTASSESSTEGPQQVRPREIEDFVNRHEFLHSAVRVGGAIFFAPNELMHPELVDRFSNALKKPSSLDSETLHILKATTRGYWQLLIGGSVAYPYLFEAASGHLKMVVHLLKGSLLPSTRSALSAIASETTQLAGRLLGNMHLYDQAQSHYDLALVTGQEANNDTLYATALGYIGWLMNLTSHPGEAIVYLEEAKHIATHGNAYTLLCFLAAEQAEAHADIAVQVNTEQPDDHDCLRSLEAVNTFVERIQPEEETFGLFFDASRQAAYHGSCYMRLKQPHLARPALLSGLTMPEPLAVFTRGILLDLTTTSIQEQEIEQACSYIHQSLDIILPTHAMKDLHRVRRLREQLEPWAAVQAVKEVDERLMTFQDGSI